jgi:hypothetical protein
MLKKAALGAAFCVRLNFIILADDGQGRFWYLERAVAVTKRHCIKKARYE